MNNLIEKLDWDSDFFGFNVGSMILSKHLTDKEWKELAASEYRLIYLFAEQKLRKQLFYTRRMNYEIVLKENEHSLYKPRENTVIVPTCNSNIDKKELVDLAVQAGSYSRFKQDKALPPNSLSDLYKQWIDRAFIHESIEIFVFMEDGLFKGFIQFQWLEDSMRILFISVKEAFRQQGIGTKLIDFALSKASEQNISKVTVITQEKNINANKLYIKKGFTIASKPYIYHYWKPIS